MAKKPDFTVYHTRSYVDGNGEEKAFTAIGSAWSVKDGGMSVEIEQGLSVSGRFVILARKERQRAADDGAHHAAPAQGGFDENGEEIPF